MASLLTNSVALFVVLPMVTLVQCQEVDLKRRAALEFERGDYPRAIALLEQAADTEPDDAEIYYLLGYYTHYLCYDSRPLEGYDEEWSDRVLAYLNRAIALNPEYGNAYYFIGAEYGARFRNAMQQGNVEKMRAELRAGRHNGGYPDWLMEYARNTLESCDPNAILFAGGDAEVNPIRYLQLIENHRTDVTVIPVVCLNWPWYAAVLKNGVGDALVSAPISWSEEQILAMRPYKWKTDTVEIPVSREELEKYGVLSQDSLMLWELEPDLTTDSRTFLSAGRALLANIIETNRWQRPIYFTIACPRTYMAGLDQYLQLSGLVYRVLPVEAEKHGLSLDLNRIEAVLLQPEHYRHFGDVKEHDMPRASRLLNNYRGVLFNLAQHYFETGNGRKANVILDKMEEYMPEAVFPPPDRFKRAVENLRNRIGAGRQQAE